MALTVSNVVVSAEAAREVVNGAIAEASERDVSVSIAVVDPAGTLCHLHRMEGASALTVELAVEKARTAASTGMSTRAWAKLLESDSSLASCRVLGAKIMLVPGGVPILERSTLVGGIGVSGGSYDDDELVADGSLARTGFHP